MDSAGRRATYRLDAGPSRSLRSLAYVKQEADGRARRHSDDGEQILVEHDGGDLALPGALQR